jgi:hypothetical protein
MRKFIIGLILGALLAVFGMFFYMENLLEDTVKTLNEAEIAKAHSQAMQAYQHEAPNIAIWELRHLADIETDQLQHERVYTNEIRGSLIVTRARLAKLYHGEGLENEAQTNAQIAISLLKTYSGKQTVTNLTSLLDHLQEADEQLKKEPKYE